MQMVAGGEVSNKSDIFSYGMVLYEMLTLNIPHMHVFPEENCFGGSDGSFEEAWEGAEDEYQQSLGELLLYPCMFFLTLFGLRSVSDFERDWLGKALLLCCSECLNAALPFTSFNSADFRRIYGDG